MILTDDITKKNIRKRSRNCSWPSIQHDPQRNPFLGRERHRRFYLFLCIIIEWSLILMMEPVAHAREFF